MRKGSSSLRLTWRQRRVNEARKKAHAVECCVACDDEELQRFVCDSKNSWNSIKREEGFRKVEFGEGFEEEFGIFLMGISL